MSTGIRCQVDCVPGRNGAKGFSLSAIDQTMLDRASGEPEDVYAPCIILSTHIAKPGNVILGKLSLVGACELHAHLGQLLARMFDAEKSALAARRAALARDLAAIEASRNAPPVPCDEPASESDDEPPPDTSPASVDARLPRFRSFGQAIREARERRKLAASVAAEQLGLSYKYLLGLEGGYGRPSRQLLADLAAFFDLNLEELTALLPVAPSHRRRRRRRRFLSGAAQESSHV